MSETPSPKTELPAQEAAIRARIAAATPGPWERGTDKADLPESCRMFDEDWYVAPDDITFLLSALSSQREELAETEAYADVLQGEVDRLEVWRRRVCELLAPGGEDRGPLMHDCVEGRINELVKIERSGCAPRARLLSSAALSGEPATTVGQEAPWSYRPTDPRYEFLDQTIVDGEGKDVTSVTCISKAQKIVNAANRAASPSGSPPIISDEEREALEHAVDTLSASRSHEDHLASGRIIQLLARVARLKPLTRDDDYVREVQAVSELLTDFDPTDRFASVSEHLASQPPRNQ